jgi:hypothetical protein
MDEDVLEGSYVELLGARRVFAHDVMTIPGIERILDSIPDACLYDRVVPVAREGDVVCLREEAEDAYLDWLESAGLGTRNVCAVPGPLKEPVSDRIVRAEAKGEIEKFLRGRSGPAVFSPYFAGEPERKASEYLGIPMYSDTRLAWKLNSKVHFKDMCRALGVPVLRSSVFRADEGAEALAARVADMIDETGVACIRGEHSSSASAMYLFPKVDEELIRKVLRESDKGEKYVVEPFCKKVLSSPSSTWFITREKKIYHLRTSNQILDRGVVHCGNEFPVTFDVPLVKGYALKIARHFLEENFIGPFGFDFIETEKEIFAVQPPRHGRDVSVGHRPHPGKAPRARRRRPLAEPAPAPGRRRVLPAPENLERTPLRRPAERRRTRSLQRGPPEGGEVDGGGHGGFEGGRRRAFRGGRAAR